MAWLNQNAGAVQAIMAIVIWGRVRKRTIEHAKARDPTFVRKIPSMRALFSQLPNPSYIPHRLYVFTRISVHQYEVSTEADRHSPSIV